MKAYTFHNETADVIKRFSKKQAWVHKPINEPQFKRDPYIEIYLEETPKKNLTTAVKIPFSELKKLLK